MNRWMMVVLLLTIGSAQAGEQILPVFAHRWPGHDGNLWSSEIYISNVGNDLAIVQFRGLLPGFIAEPTAPCQAFTEPLILVEKGWPELWRSSDIALGLGCSEQWIGALVLEVVGDVKITSRLVNHSDQAEPQNFLSGFGQLFEPFEAADLRAGRQRLPGMAWSPTPCNGPRFSMFAGFVNPGPEPVSAQLWVDRASRIVIGGELIEQPYSFVIGAESWRQIEIVPIEEPYSSCLQPQLVDVHVDSDGPLAVYGSVVDRSNQDPRTVKALAE